MSDKTWKYVQIFCYTFIIVGGFFAVYLTAEPVGNGEYQMVRRPWWFNPLIGLLLVSGFTVTLAEVRRRNGGEVTGKVVGQTFLWIAITVGFLMFIWYLRGDFN
ncbi:hypothetical protein ACSVDE_18830 [Pseudalkalibacillus sp. Hm43]|uniref:hypothetical protein n=1 Tax=Pseudalkalibacillus sp. Hm43 TaxID=3450742 RepID=UPI003F4330B4